MPSLVRNPWTPEAGALRGSPASTRSTERRDLPSINAPPRPAAPPPTTTTSYIPRLSAEPFVSWLVGRIFSPVSGTYSRLSAGLGPPHPVPESVSRSASQDVLHFPVPLRKGVSASGEGRPVGAGHARDHQHLGILLGEHGEVVLAMGLRAPSQTALRRRPRYAPRPSARNLRDR